MVIPLKAAALAGVFFTGSTSRRSTVTVKVIESSSQAHHIDTESNLVSDSRQSLSLRATFCCELNCLAGGHRCHLGNAGTFELGLVLQDYEANAGLMGFPVINPDQLSFKAGGIQ